MDNETLRLYNETGKSLEFPLRKLRAGQPQGKSKESGDPPNTADLPPAALDYLNSKRNIIISILTMPGCHAMSHVAMMKLVYDAAHKRGWEDAQES